MMVPVALAFIFNIRHWWKNEDGLKKKLISAPFLILQLYPPFAALRLVVYLITRNKKWFKAKKIYDIGMTSIGKSSEFIEYNQYIFSFTPNYLIEKNQSYSSLDHLSPFRSTSVPASDGTMIFLSSILLSINPRTADQLKCPCCDNIG